MHAPQLRCNFLELLNWQTLDSESCVDLVEVGTLNFPNSPSVHGSAVKHYEHYAVAWCVHLGHFTPSLRSDKRVPPSIPVRRLERIVAGIGIRSQRQSKNFGSYQPTDVVRNP